MTEETATERVTQLWPPSIKERVREKVGARGVTRYTLEAIREKLAREDAAQVAAEALGEPVAPVLAPVVATPVAVVEREPIIEEPTVVEEAPALPVEQASAERSSKLLEGEDRGAEIDVVTTSSGASTEYGSSRAKVEAMLEKARSLGVTKASELPVPPPKPLEVISEPDPEVIETPEEAFVEEPVAAPEPPAKQERDPVFRITDKEADVIAQPVQTPARNLDDVEVDF